MIPIINSIVQKDGGSIYMPKWFQGQSGWGNLAHPDVYAATTEQGWPCGTIYREGDRTFIYTKMGATNDSAFRSAGYFLRTKAAYASTSSGMQSAAIDAIDVVVNSGGAHAVDVYSGGMLGVYGTWYATRFIVASGVADTSTTVDYDMALTLDRGFPIALSTSDNITLTPNIYGEVNSYITQEFSRWIGVIMHHQVSAGEFSWLQCGGPHGMTFYFGSATGALHSGSTFYAYHGTCQALEDQATDAIGGVVTGSIQEIGTRLGYTSADMSGGQSLFLNILN